MDTGELLDLTAELVDALAEATAHMPCDDPVCLLCGDVNGRDVFTLLHALERALGSYMVTPEARTSEAGLQVHAILDRMRLAPMLRTAPFWGRPGALALPEFDGTSALRLYVFLKAVSLNVGNHGGGWPRIET